MEIYKMTSRGCTTLNKGYQCSDHF